MSNSVIFLNLTNGLQYLDLNLVYSPYYFVRIQSTACEQKRWDFILQELDHTFLFHLALGSHCSVWDAGHQGMSRALWQGIPWVVYAANKHWYNVETRAICRGIDCTDYFRRMYATISRRTRKKLYYHRQFACGKPVSIERASVATQHDGNYLHWADVAKRGVRDAVSLSCSPPGCLPDRSPVLRNTSEAHGQVGVLGRFGIHRVTVDTVDHSGSSRVNVGDT